MTRTPLRIGLVARADNTGLGIQTHEFYRHMEPHKTMVVDISRYNGNQQYPERYPGAQFVFGMPTAEDIERFLQDLDVVFVAEAPYNYYLYQRARELGVKTAVQYNYEFFDWFIHPEWPKPDMLIAPSVWHYEEVNAWCNSMGLSGQPIAHVYLHCPVNRDVLPRREILEAKTFLHVAGRSAAHDRNGTLSVIAASKYLKSDATIVVHFQGEQGIGHQATHTFDDYFSYLNEHGGEQIIMTQGEHKDYQDIYKNGDVLLLPRRYGGNCLPLNEAMSVGMPVIMSDISPNNKLLPPEWLVPATHINTFTPRTTIDIYDVSPQELAAKIDEFATMGPKRFKRETDLADAIADSISWSRLKPRYLNAFEGLCRQ